MGRRDGATGQGSQADQAGGAEAPEDRAAGQYQLGAVSAATTRPTQVGKPFTRWSIRKLADHLRRNIARPIRIGREALRCLPVRRGISFQRTKSWKEYPDMAFDAKLERIEYAINERPDRTFAFDEFGPLGIRPTAGSCWAEETRPDRDYLG
ncbi:hypothetical protein Slala05_78680 [Streptomyces lavendulae subsp. lavendulae]|nr:hypothetical protein Slala05_78680 [Streptomyces lavendulae subsp. lavendulae]